MAGSSFDRRTFLRVTGLGATSALLGGSIISACTPQPDWEGIGAEYQPSFVPEGTILDLPASEAPIDHVVIVMMENRSFDHYLGWLASDIDYLERGVDRYGPTFRIDAKPRQTYLDPDGNPVDTFRAGTGVMAGNPRGCGFEDPGHGWNDGRSQRDDGFLAEDSGNDLLALTYHEAEDLPFTSRLARRFTTFDRYHASVLGPTFPNRHYLHTGQSGGINHNYIPIKELGFDWPTIWDDLRRAGVSVRSYFSDLPSLGLYGARMIPVVSTIDRYFDDCAAGRLPQVTHIDPPYAPWWQADDHPLADPIAGQRFLTDVFRAFAKSPHWERGLFIVTYDEWGGFFDHVEPPVLPDDRASDIDDENFGQAGFRVPTILASPFARPGYVDHRTYDHTSIMRFLQWRFLGAPPEGPGTGDQKWWLTTRNRYSNNLGASLGISGADPGLFDLDDIPLRAITPTCEGQAQLPRIGEQPRRTRGNQPTPAGAATTAAAAITGAVGTAATTSGRANTAAAVTPTADPTPVEPTDGHDADLLAATCPGPGRDLIEARDNGFFEAIGVDATPSEIAGTWARVG